MKHLLAACLFAAIFPRLFAQIPVFDPSALENIAQTEGKAHRGHILAPEGLAPSGNYDVVYHRMRWTVDPNTRYLTGSVTTHFSSLTDGLASVAFDLTDSLQVVQVDWHGQPVAGFVHENNILTIPLAQTLPTGALDSVTVHYQGTPSSSGFGSFEQAFHNGTPVLWTLSEPYGARDWWPCKQDLSDKIDSIDVYVTTPQAYRAAGNGVLVSETPVANGFKTYHWRHRHPVANYLVAFAVTDYVQYTDYAEIQSGSLPILNYVYPENLIDAQNQTPLCADFMTFFDSLFVPYPFEDEKYGHAQFSWGGGMEHQTMSFMGNFGFELMAHELAHQWFGDHVTCGSWEDIWLNEGFATYLTGLCYERFSPQWWRNFRAVRMTGVTSQPDGSVWCNDTTSVSRIFSSRLSYSKGMLVLHQLRWLLGDEAFFTALRNYLNDRGGGFARTGHLQDHFEAASGTDLDFYFNDWIYGEGYPSYHLFWLKDGTTASFQVVQNQSHPSVPVFEMEVPVRFTDGNQTFDARLQLTGNYQEFQVEVPFSFTDVLFDPDLWLISANNSIGPGIIATSEPEMRPLALSPNPAVTHVVVNMPDGKPFDTLFLTDALGKTVQHVRLNGQNFIELDVSSLPTGFYQVTCRGKNNLGFGSFIKQ